MIGEQAVGRRVSLLIALHRVEVADHLRLHLRELRRRRRAAHRRAGARPAGRRGIGRCLRCRRRRRSALALACCCSGLLKPTSFAPHHLSSAWRSVCAFRVNGAYGVSAISTPKMPM